MQSLGVDIVSVDRIAGLLARHGDRFLTRCFQSQEAMVATRPGRAGAQAVAARWAAKEACIKAFGSQGRTIPYRDIEVLKSVMGEPSLQLHGLARSIHEALGSPRILISLSHEREMAVAVVAFVAD